MERLPRGPHKLKEEEVLANQRERLAQALVDLIGINGYHATSVAEVLKLASVSRRSFYELFSDREDLLKYAFRTSAGAALADVNGAREHGEKGARALETVIASLWRAGEEAPGAITLWSVEIAAAQDEGFRLRRELMQTYGELIESCLRRNGDGPMPGSLAGTLAGALQRTVAARLREARLDGGPEAAVQQLVRWLRCYDHCPLDPDLRPDKPWPWIQPDGLAGGRAPGTLTVSPDGYLPRIGRTSAGFRAHATRERVLDVTARIVAESGYSSLTAEGIVERAEIPQNAFTDQFKSSDEAFTAALEVGHMKAQAVAERILEGASSWRAGIQTAIRGLLEFFASEPYFTRLAFIDAPRARPATARRTNEHAATLAEMMFEKAPQRRQPPAIAGEAIVQALFEIVYRHASEDRIAELPAASGAADYIALAPFVGAKEAAQAAQTSR